MGKESGTEAFQLVPSKASCPLNTYIPNIKQFKNSAFMITMPRKMQNLPVSSLVVLLLLEVKLPYDKVCLSVVGRLVWRTVCHNFLNGLEIFHFSIARFVRRWVGQLVQVCRLICCSVIISHEGGRSQFHALGPLVFVQESC